jgi:hypothetical protein
MWTKSLSHLTLPHGPGSVPGATFHGIFQVDETAITLLSLLRANYPQALQFTMRLEVPTRGTALQGT